jgi:dedicator of cytokinesis protein 3
MQFNSVSRLLDRVQSEDPTWKESGAAFISSVTRLLERLLDYRSVIQGDENRDKRMSCTVNLLVYIYIDVTMICSLVCHCQ